MSQQNVEIVRRIYREVSSHGRAPAEVFDPEYALDLTDAKPDLGVLQGGHEDDGKCRAGVEQPRNQLGTGQPRHDHV